MGKGEHGCGTQAGVSINAALEGSQLVGPGGVADDADVQAMAANTPGRAKSRGRRKEYTEEEKKARKEMIDKRLQELEDHVSRLSSHPEEIKEWLDKMFTQRLWRYSFGNIMLASFEAKLRGFQISRLSSFKDWNKHGYKVRKGEKGLPILVPKTVGVWADKKDSAGNPVMDAKGKPQKTKVGQRLAGFKGGFVFDISQVEPMLDDYGEPIAKELQGAHSSPQAETAIQQLRAVAESQEVVVVDDVNAVQDPALSSLGSLLASMPDADGFFTEVSTGGSGGEKQRVIVLRPGLSSEREAKVMAHELVHAVLHNSKEKKTDDEKTRMRKEVEAEGAAYVISSHYGFGDQAQAAYVAHWAKGKEVAELKAATGSIQRAVRVIMEGVEEIEGGED